MYLFSEDNVAVRVNEASSEFGTQLPGHEMRPRLESSAADDDRYLEGRSVSATLRNWSELKARVRVYTNFQ